MGARRRRRKLTTLMGRFDNRIRDVELRPINLLTSSQIDAAVTIAPPGVTPSTVVGASAPAQFRKIQDAYIYPKKLTGLSEDRVEIYLESDLGLEVGETIEVSGIHGTSTEDIDVDGTFEVKETDTPPWTGRDSYDHDPTNDQLSGVTISNTYSFKPDTVAPTTWSTRKRLQTRRLVDTYEITSTTVTLTMNADHKFEAGDIIFVDIFAEDSRAYGVDGLFEIDSVTNNTIVYTLSAGVDTPVSATIPAADVYVFPVAREYLPIGSTWASSNNNKIYYWDGIRWVDYSTVSSPAQDGDPPAPPTSLSVSDTPAVSTTQYIPYSKVTLSWTAPTQTAAGDPLTDLLGYRIRWRRSVSEDWREKDVRNPSATSYTFDDDALLEQGTTYYFELYAYDSGLQDSTAATASHTTDQLTGDIDTYPPTDPTATSRLGTITVTWDGNLKTGPSTTTAAPEDVVLMRIYVDTSSSAFTPSSSNLAKSVKVWGSDGGFDVLTDLSYSTTYYIKITVVNTSGFESDPSAAVSAQVQPLVDADLVTNTLSTWPFQSGTVSAGALASGAINASNMFGPDVVVQDAIAANAIGADQIAAGSIIAGKIGANAVTAATINAGAITADKIATNAVTADKITAGAITAVKIAATTITGDKIAAGTISADKLTASYIQVGGAAGDVNSGTTTISGGKITANSITASQISSAYVYAGTLNADNMTTGTLRGRTIWTQATPGSTAQRVLMSGSSHTLKFYASGDADTNEAGTIQGDTNGMTLWNRNNDARLSLGTSGTLTLVSTNSRVFQASGTSTGGYGWRGSPNIGSSAGIGVTNRYAYYDQFGWLQPGFNYSSDVRLKTEILPLSSGIDFINQLNPVQFRWKEEEGLNTGVQFGLIAQEVRDVVASNLKVETPNGIIPINEEEDKYMALNYEHLVPHLIKSVQELSAKIEELESKE